MRRSLLCLFTKFDDVEVNTWKLFQRYFLKGELTQVHGIYLSLSVVSGFRIENCSCSKMNIGMLMITRTK